MNSKNAVLLTKKNSEANAAKNVKKTGRVKTAVMFLMMTLILSCTLANVTTVSCSAKETKKITAKLTSSKKNSRKKKSSKKTTKKKKSRKKKSSNERYKVYPTPAKNSFKSYMSYRAVSSSSAQGKLQAQAKTDSQTGIRTVDGRYCIALGSFYCSKIGTKIDLVMENGSVVKCILADQKANRDTDSKNQKTSDGSMAEFLVDMNKLPSKAKMMGDVSYTTSALKGSISKVRVYQ
jgi:hypothetical protein